MKMSKHSNMKKGKFERLPKWAQDELLKMQNLMMRLIQAVLNLKK